MHPDLLDFVYSKIITDPTMLTLFGTTPRVRMAYEVGEVAAPYIIHFWTSNIHDPWAIVVGTWTVHTWDYGPNCDRALHISQRLKKIFDRLYYPSVTNLCAVRFWLKGDTIHTENEDRVWHLIDRFGIRYVDSQHITDVVERLENTS